MPPLAIAFLLALFLLAAAELTVLVKVAGLLGVLPTLVLLIGVGILGMNLVRRQGLATLIRAQGQMQTGRLPAAELFDGACLLLAGLLLALPGFLSDVAACGLLLPPVRRLLYKALARRLHDAGDGRGVQRGMPPRSPARAVIEGEYEEVGPVSETRDGRRGR